MQQCMNKGSEEEEGFANEKINTLNTFVRPQKYAQFILALNTEYKDFVCLKQKLHLHLLFCWNQDVC